MKLWEQLEILRDTQKSWFRKSKDDKKINALKNIQQIGDIHAVPYLFPLLKDESSEIRNISCSIIVTFFSKISSKNRYYEILRYSNISENDIHFYKENFDESDYRFLLAIASFNSSGFTREKAVTKLAETKHPFAIRFVIYRLADWVPNVRIEAQRAFDYFKKEKFIDGLIENLETLEWLESVERIELNHHYSGTLEFILSTNQYRVFEKFKFYSDKTRKIFAKYLTKKETIDSNAIELLLDDRHFIIRELILNKFGNLSDSQIKKLLNDRSARIRYKTLQNIQSSPEFEKIVFEYIADKSAMIRHFARYVLKHNISDFGTIYNENLLKKQQIIGSLSGIAEMNGNEYIDTLLPFLADETLQIKKSAFFALKKLNESIVYDFALENLNTEFASLRNLVIDYLQTRATTEVLEKSRVIYKNGSTELKLSMLHLFSKIGNWSTISDIMLATIDENEAIRKMSVIYIHHWKTKSTGNFMQPKSGELERANQIFKFVFDVHEEKKHFNINPLNGVDFYLT